MNKIISIIVLTVISMTIIQCRQKPLEKCDNGLRLNGINVEDCKCKLGYIHNDSILSYISRNDKNFPGYDCTKELKNYEWIMNKHFISSVIVAVGEPINEYFDDSYIKFYDLDYTGIYVIPEWNKYDCFDGNHGYRGDIYGRVKASYNPRGPILNGDNRDLAPFDVYAKRIKYDSINLLWYDSVVVDMRPLGIDKGYTRDGEGIMLTYTTMKNQNNQDTILNPYLCILEKGVTSLEFDSIKVRKKIPLINFKEW